METLTIGKKQYAVVPMQDYEAILERLETLQDVKSMQQFDQDLASQTEEVIPSEFAERIIFGENPYLVWREYRGLKLKDISDATNIDIATLSRIENNKREPSVKQVKAIAAILKVSVADLI